MGLDQEFFTEKELGKKVTRGDTFSFRGKKYRVVQKDEYPIGNSGVWAVEVGNDKKNDKKTKLEEQYIEYLHAMELTEEDMSFEEWLEQVYRKYNLKKNYTPAKYNPNVDTISSEVYATIRGTKEAEKWVWDSDQQLYVKKDKKNSAPYLKSNSSIRLNRGQDKYGSKKETK